MKILLLHDVQADKQNGVSVSLGILYRELKKTDNEIKILTLSDDPHSRRDGDNYFLSSVPALIYPGIRMRAPIKNHFIDEIIDWNPDVIHTNCEFSTFLIARQIHRDCKLPPVWVHTFHTDYKYYIGALQKISAIKDKAVPWVLNKCFTAADVLIVPTQKMYSYVKNDPIFSESLEMRIIPTGIDFSELEKASGTNPSETKKQLGIPENAKVVLFLGRISQEKNLDELIEHFKAYRKKHDNVYLLTVGDGPYMDTLKRKASDKSVSDRIIVHGGVPHTEIRKYYDAADVFASASLSETQGLTFYEALYCNVPVIAADRICLEAAITEGRNGAFFTGGDEFEKALDSVIDIKSGGGSKTQLPECFTSESFAKSVEKLYRELLERRTELAEKRRKKPILRFELGE